MPERPGAAHEHHEDLGSQAFTREMNKHLARSNLSAARSAPRLFNASSTTVEALPHSPQRPACGSSSSHLLPAPAEHRTAPQLGEHRSAPRMPPGARSGHPLLGSVRSPRAPIAWDDESGHAGTRDVANRFLPQYGDHMSRPSRLPPHVERALQYGPEGPMGRGERTAAEQLQRELAMTAQLLKTAHEQIAIEQDQVTVLRLSETRAVSAADQARADIQAMVDEHERAQQLVIEEMAEQRSALETELESTREERRAQLERVRSAEDENRAMRATLSDQEERIVRLQARTRNLFTQECGRECGARS
eukprot:4291742-Prymnesium_polylepis.1